MRNNFFFFPGQIYKLRTPSTRYLASLSTYDSANPTKDWGLPDLLVNMHSIAHANLGANHESELSTGVIMCEDSCTEKVIFYYSGVLNFTSEAALFFY